MHHRTPGDVESMCRIHRSRCASLARLSFGANNCELIAADCELCNTFGSASTRLGSVVRKKEDCAVRPGSNGPSMHACEKTHCTVTKLHESVSLRGRPCPVPAELLRPRHATARSNYNFFTRRPRPPVPTTGPARRQPSRIVCDHNWPCPTWPARNRREHIHVAGSYEGGSSPPQQ